MSELQHLVAVSEQVVTGQNGAPVVRLIQDAVAVAFWLGHVQPETHCPRPLTRAAHAQLVADLSAEGGLADLAARWARVRVERADHPTVRSCAAAGVDFLTTGLAVLSLCLPPTCRFLGRAPATNHLVDVYRVGRRLPAAGVPVARAAVHASTLDDSLPARWCTASSSAAR